MHIALTLIALIAISPAASGEKASSQLTPGVAQPLRKIEVQPLIDGRLQIVHVREGEKVNAGQLIAALDDALAAATLAAAESAAAQRGRLDFARAEAELATSSWQRIQRILNHHAVAQKDVEAAQANVTKSHGNYLVAQEEWAMAQAELEQARVRIAEHSIEAPFGGIVSKIRVSAGQSVSRQTTLMQLIDLSRLQVELQVPLANYHELVVGKTYPLQAEPPVDRIVEAVLVAIDPVLDSGTQTFRCVFEIDNFDLSLPAGFLVYPTATMVATDTATAPQP